MPSPSSVDLRERVVAFVSAGASCREAGTRFTAQERRDYVTAAGREDDAAVPR